MRHLGTQKLVFDLPILLVVIALSAPCADSTIIIGIRTPEEVVIAADSMGTFSGRDPEMTKPVCKIFTVRGVGFAVAGLAKSPRGGLDADAVVTRALSGSQSLLQAATAIEAELRLHISQELERQKREEPKLFAETAEGEGGRVTSILLGAFEGGVPVAVCISFKASQDPAGKISVGTSRLTCPGDCPSGVLNFYLGNWRPIERYTSEHDQPLEMPPAAAARFLVQLVIDARVPGVGPPIDVLVISKSGVSWRALKDGCGGVPSGFQGSASFYPSD
jgi:hypothetical protein